VVSKGDSWFQYPFLLKDVIDQLFDDYAIYSLGGAGVLVSEMLDQDEIGDAIDRENPDLLFLSGRGNDLLGGSDRERAGRRNQGQSRLRLSCKTARHHTPFILRQLEECVREKAEAC